MTCGHCAHAHISGVPEDPIQCRRYPPKVKIGAWYRLEAVWPVVGEDDWCGEWKAQPPKKPQVTRAQQLKELIPDLGVMFGGEEVGKEVMEEFGAPRSGPYADPRLNIPVDEVVGTVRGLNCLKNLFWEYKDPLVGDLVQCTEVELNRQPNLGRRTLNHYKECLTSLGEPRLHLGMRPERSDNTKKAEGIT